MAACPTPPGSQGLASSPAAVVTGDSDSTNAAYMGCLRADGHARLLERFFNGEDSETYVSAAAVGADYAALATGGSAAWTAALIDGNPCNVTTSCTVEQIMASDATGLHALDATATPGSGGSWLTALSLSGSTLSWDHAGTPQSAELNP
ncbi:MAG TPA: hypothetical protein VIJ20_09945 [Solirubrobacteraceae bacterium]